MTNPATSQSVSGNESSLSIEAGGQVRLTTNLMMYQLPYNSSQYSANPELSFVAPYGVTVASVEATWVGKTGTITPILSSTAIAGGKTLYRVRFNGTAAFGGPQIINGVMKFPSVDSDSTPYPQVTLTLNTAYGMDNTQIQFIDSLFIRDENDATLSNSYYQKPDSYDLDGDGNTTEFMSGLHNMTNRQSLTITPNTKQLDFTAEAKMADEADSAYRSGTGAASRLYLSSLDDRVNYRLTLQNDSGSIVPAGNFMYYIPIPHTGNNNAMHTHMLQDNASPGFDLTLTGPVSITGTSPGLFDLRYSTDATVSNYDNGYANYDYPFGGATWRSEADMTAANVDWSDVRMIKLVAADIGQNSYIPTDTLTQFTLTLAYTGDNNSILQNARATSVWRCCGAQKYLSTGELSNGTHTPTDFVTVMLRSEETHPVTLTAAAGMAPTLPAVRTVTLPSPAYTAAKAFRIISVTSNNVVLQSSTTVIGNELTATSEFANSCFAITAKLDGGETRELSAGVGQTLGTTMANVSSDLVLTLYNYNALSDASTPRSVTLVLGDGAGVQVTVEITIARVLSAVSSAQTHIEGGKSYQLMHGTATSADIRQDSAFTVQYALTNVAANTTHTLSLMSGSFPTGTKLTLIDLTVPATPTYYYRNLTSSAQSIDLTTFQNMNGSGSNFAVPTVPSDETLLLVADFSAAPLPIGSNTLRLSLVNGAAVDIDRSLTVYPARSFSLSATSSASMAESVTVSGTASTAASGSYSDSRWVLRKMALVVTLDSGAAFPEGTVITMGGTRYVPSGKAFILPLGSIATHDYSYTLTTPHTRLTDGSHTLRTELYVSATASADAPLGDESVCAPANTALTVTGPAQCALSLSMAGDDHLFTAAEAESLTLNIAYNEAAAGVAITLELQEKVGGIYLTRTNLITGASVGGTDYIVNGYGLISLSSRDYGTGTLAVELNVDPDVLVVGNTYRILAKAAGGSGNVEAVCNIIIVE